MISDFDLRRELGAYRLRQIKKAAHTLGLHGPYWWELTKDETYEYIREHFSGDELSRLLTQLGKGTTP